MKPKSRPRWLERLRHRPYRPVERRRGLRDCNVWTPLIDADKAARLAATNWADLHSAAYSQLEAWRAVQRGDRHAHEGQVCARYDDQGNVSCARCDIKFLC